MNAKTVCLQTTVAFGKIYILRFLRAENTVLLRIIIRRLTDFDGTENTILNSRKQR